MDCLNFVNEFLVFGKLAAAGFVSGQSLSDLFGDVFFDHPTGGLDQ